jgi:hypothetical protein
MPVALPSPNELLCGAWAKACACQVNSAACKWGVSGKALEVNARPIVYGRKRIATITSDTQCLTDFHPSYPAPA